MALIEMITELFETIAFQVGWYMAFIWILESVGLV